MTTAILVLAGLAVAGIALVIYGIHGLKKDMEGY